MQNRKTHTQEVAAAKAGISVRSARRIEAAPSLPSQKPERSWRTRADPLAEVWDTEIRPLLEREPGLMGITLMRRLQEEYPGHYPDSMLRTLQRRIQVWRATSGPAREMFFAQQHVAGQMGLSDFTDVSPLGVSICGVPFPHILYHFVLAFSRWEYAEVNEGGESFEALTSGLQSALWMAGGAPREHRTDSLSAAYKNLKPDDDWTSRYSELLDHYGMVGTRNNRGVSHENGSVEGSHRHLKDELDQALLLRGYRDFDSRADYERFVRDIVLRRNRRVSKAFQVEREALRALPPRRTTDYTEEDALVTRNGTFTVRNILYSAPSRLIGHRLKVRLYRDRLECFVAGTQVLEVPRGQRDPGTSRGRVIDYRHFIENLRRKPQAFAGYQFRDALFPREAYRRTWDELSLRLPQRQACKTMVTLLDLAARDGVEAVLASRLEQILAAGELPDPIALRTELAPPEPSWPQVVVQIPDSRLYDSLLARQVAA
jgi:hypothetical protein